ncbi:MAG: hypothetical protein GY950_35990 [bacterium]|nr:hypothetical protein [bacterium]
MKKSTIIPIIVLCAAWCFGTMGCKGRSLEQLLAEGKYGAAERYCEKREGKERQECLKTVASFYYGEDNFKQAAVFYGKAGEHIRAVNCFFRGDFISDAEEYIAGLEGGTKKKCAVDLAKKFYLTGNYKKAITYYGVAGDGKMVESVTGKVPVFQLVETAAKRAGTEKDRETRITMRRIKETLKSYIYMDRYLEWSYGEAAEPDRKAAEACRKAVQMVQGEAAPVFIKKLKKVQWSKKGTRSLSFDHVKLESLINLIHHLRNIARNRKLLSTHSVLNYEAAYLNAIKHVGSLFETVEESKGIAGSALNRYEEDLAIDLETIAYISSMMDNVGLRIRDIQGLAKRFRKIRGDAAAEKVSEKRFNEFIGVCGRVLGAIGKEEYKEANKLLISGYKSIKKELNIKKEDKKPGKVK